MKCLTVSLSFQKIVKKWFFEKLTLCNTQSQCWLKLFNVGFRRKLSKKAVHFKNYQWARGQVQLNAFGFCRLWQQVPFFPDLFFYLFVILIQIYYIFLIIFFILMDFFFFETQNKFLQFPQNLDFLPPKFCLRFICSYSGCKFYFENRYGIIYFRTKNYDGVSFVHILGANIMLYWVFYIYYFISFLAASYPLAVHHLKYIWDISDLFNFYYFFQQLCWRFICSYSGCKFHFILSF